MTRLHYLPEGNPAETGRWHPGWPASDHEEDNIDLAVRKVESGLYEALPDTPAALPATPPEQPQNARATPVMAPEATPPATAPESPPTRPGG